MLEAVWITMYKNGRVTEKRSFDGGIGHEIDVEAHNGDEPAVGKAVRRVYEVILELWRQEHQVWDFQMMTVSSPDVVRLFAVRPKQD
jgi:hypothetical protein